MFTTMYEEYLEIFENRNNWFRFDNRKNFDIHQYNIDTLFTENTSKNFIRNFYYHEGLMEIMNRIKFSPERVCHTVSAFIFGVLIKNRLTLSMKTLPQVCDDYNKSFIYFWSMVCLSHDITYSIENNSSEYINKCKSIEDFIKCFNIKYNLLDKSQYSSLFKNYYKYMIDTFSRIDHGLTCGLIIYDFLMCEYNKHLEIKKQKPGCTLVTQDDWKYSKHYPSHALKIAETIARHNLWVASDNKRDIYKKYNLLELIPKTEKFFKISYTENDSLLFLLGLVDTLDPIKCFDEIALDAYEILKSINIDFKRKSKEIHIQSTKYLSKDILDKWRELSSWMSLDIVCDYDMNQLKIKFEYNSESNEKLAA